MRCAMERSACRNILDRKECLINMLLRTAELSNNPPRRSLLRLVRQVYICANTYICIYLPARWTRTRLPHAYVKMMYAVIMLLIRAGIANDGSDFVCPVWVPYGARVPYNRIISPDNIHMSDACKYSWRDKDWESRTRIKEGSWEKIRWFPSQILIIRISPLARFLDPFFPDAFR